MSMAIQCQYLAADLVEMSAHWPSHAAALRRLALDLMRIGADVTQCLEKLPPLAMREDNVVSLEQFLARRG
jgi:hypothetical protein